MQAVERADHLLQGSSLALLLQRLLLQRPHTQDPHVKQDPHAHRRDGRAPSLVYDTIVSLLGYTFGIVEYSSW